MTGSSTGTASSTRRSRLRPIQSALAMYDLALAAVFEDEHPRVLEKAPDDAAHANVLAHARDAGTQHAHAAHEQIDRHAGLRRAVERAHDVAFGDRVDLRANAARAAGARVLGFAVDPRDQLAVQRDRRDPQVFVIGDLREAGERVEELRVVGSELGAAREEAQIGVEQRRLLVVVAGAEVHVAAQAVLVFAHDQQRLRVHLLIGEAVDDVRAGALEPLRPFDVVLFVEARLELDDDRDLLLVLGRGRAARARSASSCPTCGRASP